MHARKSFYYSSSGTNLADLGYSPLKSSYHTDSVQTPGMTGRLSQANYRRSSIYQPRQSMMSVSGRPSGFPSSSQPGGSQLDARQLKQARLRDLYEYMKDKGFEAYYLEQSRGYRFTENTLKSPTQKDFTCIFQWLFHRIDPNYKFVHNIDKEVPPILDMLEYPYAQNITRRHLEVAGSEQNWGTILGLLHWIMQLARMLEGFMAVENSSAEHDMILDSLREVRSVQRSDKSRVEKSREVDHGMEVLKSALQEKRRKNEKELQELEKENSRLLKEKNAAETTSLQVLELDKAYDDLIKREQVMKDEEEIIQAEIDELQRQSTELENQLQELEQQFLEKKEERKKKKQELASQGFSLNAINTILKEQYRLDLWLKEEEEKRQEAKNTIKDREETYCSKLEKLDDVIRAYNSLAEDIRLIPATADNAKGRDYEVKLLVDNCYMTSSSHQGSTAGGSGPMAWTDRLLADAPAGYQANQVVNLDLRGDVEPSCLALKDEIRARHIADEEWEKKTKEQLKALDEAIKRKRDEEKSLKFRIQTAEQDFNTKKEQMETMRTKREAEFEKIMGQEGKTRHENETLEDQIQLEEMKAVNEEMKNNELERQGPEQREQLRRAMESNLKDVLGFTTYIKNDFLELLELLEDTQQAERGTGG